jgi:transposase InsO family protein
VLDRDFTAAAPNQRWGGDTTEFVIGENAKLDLAAILDLYSRFVVGWAISAVNDRRLTLKALEMAVQPRCPEPGLLHHSTRALQGLSCRRHSGSDRAERITTLGEQSQSDERFRNSIS